MRSSSGTRSSMRCSAARRRTRSASPTVIAKPGARFLRGTRPAIDPEARSVTTDAGVHEADTLFVALGADYDFDATPRSAEGGDEFYSVASAERLAELLPTFS